MTHLLFSALLSSQTGPTSSSSAQLLISSTIGGMTSSRENLASLAPLQIRWFLDPWRRKGDLKWWNLEPQIWSEGDGTKRSKLNVLKSKHIKVLKFVGLAYLFFRRQSEMNLPEGSWYESKRGWSQFFAASQFKASSKGNLLVPTKIRR